MTKTRLETIKNTLKPYADKDLATKGLEKKIEELMKFFDFYGVDYDKFKPERLEFATKSNDKKAYPNYEVFTQIAPQHDLSKWLRAVKIIYAQKESGVSYANAVKRTTMDWKKTEVFDFLNWLKFYEEGAHMKYKFAQVWYDGQSGYFLDVKKDQEDKRVADENAAQLQQEQAEQARIQQQEQETKRKQIIEQQRSKIISRLDSAEKLIRSTEGQLFADTELNNLMMAIHELKRRVALVNKMSTSTRLYEDMIVREANILGRQGFIKAADLLYSVAQTPGASGQSAKGEGTIDLPEPTPSDNPTGAGHPGLPGTLPAEIPGTPNINTTVNSDQNKDQPPVSAIKAPTDGSPNATMEETPAVIPQEAPQPKGIQEFIANMNDGTNNDADELEVEDTEEELMVSEAQMLPKPPAAALEDVPMTADPAPAPRDPPPPVKLAPEISNEPAKPATEEPLEVLEDDVPKEPELPAKDTSVFDAKVDEVFANITVADVVSKLEDLSKIFKTKEIPRQLAFVDMMLDALGLVSYFPSLSEAQNKAIDSNNYISTRVEDILSQLRGALTTKELDLKGTDKESPESVAGIKNNLQQSEDKEKQRKQMRKEQEMAENVAPNKETPNVEMEELAPPAPKPIAAV